MCKEKKRKEICTCFCHVKGSVVMHMMACCQHTYEHYINKDGTIDMKIYNELEEKRNQSDNDK